MNEVKGARCGIVARPGRAWRCLTSASVAGALHTLTRAGRLLLSWSRA